MALVLLLLFVIVPLIELYVIVQVAGYAGIIPTLVLLLAISVAGSFLVKFEGLGVLRRMQRTVRHGELPTDEIVNGVLILFAGALLLTPGFVTDAFGLFMLIPPSRAVLRKALLSRFRGGITSSFGFASADGVGGRGWAWSSQSRTPTGDSVIITDADEIPSSDSGREPPRGEIR